MTFLIQLLGFLINILAVAVDILVHVTNVIPDVLGNITFSLRGAHIRKQPRAQH
ncbi:hypothetical protein D3C80_2160840 [compost metagenome]